MTGNKIMITTNTKTLVTREFKDGEFGYFIYGYNAQGDSPPIKIHQEPLGSIEEVQDTLAALIIKYQSLVNTFKTTMNALEDNGPIDIT